ncbi:phosphoribosylformylglycinamidine synthase subunit PurQ [Polycladidibacter hongkongensis]|uniref:phosphoribosylformylglycinamidine synthase subunit PurQ n=1 Tax=Polycladidibacter hongkongensis TaxID=1647556 RepID=UPI0008330084|nr:phosphoribosylformylglycinamidine synthase subunit PurQ [Pseudovibrio hongkongensis]
MKSAVLLFPGSNRDRDMIKALEHISGNPVATVWHTETTLPEADLYVLPGGFSYGDYLRSGAIAARSPIMGALKSAAAQGKHVLGVCNGFQMLTEAGLLPGALMRNASLHFVCKNVELQTTSTNSPFTQNMASGAVWQCPVAHHDGNYFADSETLNRLEGEGCVAFRYANGTNPNGSINDIAGITSENGRILGMMPHPENLIEDLHGGLEGRALFESVMQTLDAA